MSRFSQNLQAFFSLLSVVIFVPRAVTAQPEAGGCVEKWLQCGGWNYFGATDCCEGTRCEYVNDWWWQCNPSGKPVVTETEAPTASPTGSPTPSPTPLHTPHPTSSGPLLVPTPAPSVGLPTPDTQAPTSSPSPAPTISPTAPLTPETSNSPTPLGTGPSMQPTTAADAPWNQECFRTRKNIVSLSEEEVNTLIEGFQLLKDNGVYQRISAMHADGLTFGLFHGNDFFLPWHRWYVFRIETAIRNLGGKFSCFAMPYWDWTMDSGNEMNSPVWDMFGGLGQRSSSFCVKNGPFSSWKTLNGPCLKRIGTSSYRFFTPAEVRTLITRSKSYANNGFRASFETGAHARPHLFIGGDMNTFASPEDPIFWLHHTFVDLVWAMWQDCYRFLDPNHIPQEQFPTALADIEMYYTNGITPRKVWNINQMGYTFQTDDFSGNSILHGSCDWVTLKHGSTSPANFNIKPELSVSSPKSGVSNNNGTTSRKPAMPLKSIHLMSQEMGIYQDCVKKRKEERSAAPKKGPVDATTLKGIEIQDDQECLKVVTDFQCGSLGAICDLPQAYVEGMKLEQDKDSYKSMVSCTAQCPAPEAEAAMMMMGGGKRYLRAKA